MSDALRNSRNLRDHVWAEELAGLLGINPQATHQETCAALEAQLGFLQEGQGQAIKQGLLMQAAYRLQRDERTLGAQITQLVEARMSG